MQYYLSPETKAEWARLVFLLKFYAVVLLAFVVAKPLFLFDKEWDTVGDYFAVVWHGLPLDIATAGYATAPVWLVLLVQTWVRVPFTRAAYKTYTLLIAFLAALGYVVNIKLYDYWHFPLDNTALTLFFDSPAAATASVSVRTILLVVVLTLIAGGLFLLCLRQIYPDKPFVRPKQRIAQSVSLVLLGGLLFVGIRGGVDKSTANVGMVYYSQTQLLNHAAVNPLFSLIASAAKGGSYAKAHQYFSEETLQREFARLEMSTESKGTKSLLKNTRPNVIVIVMEGISANFVHALEPEAPEDITPTLNQLCAEGVCFTHCYGNTFRTDRGVVCALSGYPSFPDVSVMKLPRKCANLPSIARSLKQAGYTTSFLYGGDINFTNTRGYLLSTGYETIVSQDDFTAAERRTHNWGVTDSITFDRLFDMATHQPADKPWHIGFLTLASHEPWEVPYHRIKGDIRANAFSYLDHCIGRFIQRFRQTPQWENTLIVLIPDHGIDYPAGVTNPSPRRNHIPLIWTGGAVAHPTAVDVLCNQTDLAATLLGQLHLPHTDFRFSRDVLSATYTRPFAYHAWPEGISILTPDGFTAINLKTTPQTVYPQTENVPSTPSEERQKAANALLQMACEDLDGR